MPAQTAQEFVALAKSQPGKLTYSLAGTGNGSHLTVELFRAAAGGLEMVHVPYKGGAPAIQALLAGEVQLTAVSVNAACRTSRPARCGRWAWPRRSARRRCPTCRPSSRAASRSKATAGWPLGPPGIPADVATKLNQEIAATLREPQTQERLAKLGLVVVASPQSGLADVLQRDVPKWGKAVKDLGAVAE